MFFKKSHEVHSRARSRGRQRGQGMTEYILIVALIAIAAIVVVTMFGNNLRALFGASANTMIGENTTAEDLGADEVSEDDVRRDLKSAFDEGP